jgi:hypothetical protein
MNIIWVWVPNSSLGPIRLGDQINSCIQNLHLSKDDDAEDDVTNWIGYKLPDVDIYIYVENEIIVSITSYENFFYKNKNIIGMQVDQLSEILDCEPSEQGKPVLFEDGDIQTPFEYFHFGLQLWVSNEVVMSASIINGRSES